MMSLRSLSSATPTTSARRACLRAPPVVPVVRQHNPRRSTTRSGVAAVDAAPTSSKEDEASAMASTDEEDLTAMAELAEEELDLATASVSTPLGRGLVLTQPVQRQAVVSIPMRHALVVSDDPLNAISVFGDRAIAEWGKVHAELPKELLEFVTGEQRWDVRLTAWLLWLLDNEGSMRSKQPKWAADAPASLWDLYLHQLPDEREMSCLLNYAPEEAQELQVKRLIEEAKVQHEWVLYLHERWFSKRTARSPRALHLAHGVKETLWASAMVRSRTFSEEVNGEGLTLMVPWADLANHSANYNSTFCISKDRESFELRSVRPLEAGEQLLISYGDTKGNAELMRDYGFVLPGNPWDRLPMPGQDLFPDHADAEQQRRRLADGPKLNGASLFEAADMQGDWTRGEVQPMEDSLDELEDEADWERRRAALLSLPLTDGNQGLWGGLQSPEALHALTTGQEDSKQRQQGGKPRKLKATEVTSERAATAHFLKHLKSLAAELPTTIESDQELLRGGSGVVLTPRHAAAVRCRLEYKKVLRQGMDTLALYDELLADSVELPGQN